METGCRLAFRDTVGLGAQVSNSSHQVLRQTFFNTHKDPPHPPGRQQSTASRHNTDSAFSLAKVAGGWNQLLLLGMQVMRKPAVPGPASPGFFLTGQAGLHLSRCTCVAQHGWCGNTDGDTVSQARGTENRAQ